MNKKAWYTFRIVLGGYLAWLGIRMLIEMVNEKPNNMVYVCDVCNLYIDRFSLCYLLCEKNV